MKIEIVFDYHPRPEYCENCADMPEWYAHIPSMPGMGESGMTRRDAFEELMISLKVLLMYENKIEP